MQTQGRGAAYVPPACSVTMGARILARFTTLKSCRDFRATTLPRVRANARRSQDKVWRLDGFRHRSSVAHVADGRCARISSSPRPPRPRIVAIQNRPSTADTAQRQGQFYALVGRDTKDMGRPWRPTLVDSRVVWVNEILVRKYPLFFEHESLQMGPLVTCRSPLAP